MLGFILGYLMGCGGVFALVWLLEFLAGAAGVKPGAPRNEPYVSRAEEKRLAAAYEEGGLEAWIQAGGR